jgi:hypothetical protein
MSTELGCQEDHASTATLLDVEGRRLAEAAIVHPAATDLRPTILQALGCLDRSVELSCSAVLRSQLLRPVAPKRERGRFTGQLCARPELAAPPVRGVKRSRSGPRTFRNLDQLHPASGRLMRVQRSC